MQFRMGMVVSSARFNFKIGFSLSWSTQRPRCLTSFVLRVWHERLLHGLRTDHLVLLVRGQRSDGGHLCHSLQSLDYTDVAQLLRYRHRRLPLLHNTTSCFSLTFIIVLIYLKFTVNFYFWCLKNINCQKTNNKKYF